MRKCDRASGALLAGLLFFGLVAFVGVVGVARAQAETLGFVVSAWGHRVPKTEPAHCPEGMNLTEAEHYRVDMRQFRSDMKAMGYQAATQKHFPPDACPDPTAQADPGFRTFDTDVPLPGLDLDTKHSRKADGAACAHDDFTGTDGTSGIDNQYWRLVGCTEAYQFGGRIDRQNKGQYFFVKEGTAILLEIRGVDDRKNDPEVEVRIFSSSQEVTLDANGGVVPHVSMDVHGDPRYWSPPARGKIENGVLTTEPIDLKLRFKQEIIDGELYYRDARLRAELKEDGSLAGILGYYWDAENLYRINNDHAIGENHTGRLLSLARGYSCAGLFHAIERVADGHRDAETGRCTSVSAASYFKAIPAFVIADPT